MTYYHPGLIDSRYPIFSMKENSAVIFVGCTPSSTSYFSWRSYAFFSRRQLVFASLGDSLNNLVINTTSDDGNTGGQLTSVITTADATMYQELTSVLSDNGVTHQSLRFLLHCLTWTKLNSSCFIVLRCGDPNRRRKRILPRHDAYFS